MASSIPLQLAETIQTAHIIHDPSAERDLAPSTAADTMEPVVLEEADGEGEEGEGDEGDDREKAAHYSVIRPWDPAVDSGRGLGRHGGTPAAGLSGRRRPSSAPRQPLPPLPDLRFEQSYLRSLAAADTWWKVALVTARDQVLMPLAQGLLYNLAVCGWQHWNRTAALGGQSAGARLRRWWYGVNNWPLPAALLAGGGAAAKPARPVQPTRPGWPAPSAWR